MKKTLKKPLIVFLVISTVLIGAWLVFFLLLGLLPSNGAAFGANFIPYIRAKWDMLLEIFKCSYGFAPGASELWWTTYDVFVASGLFLIGLVVGLILCIKRKTKRYLGYIAVMLVATIAVFDFGASTVSTKCYADGSFSTALPFPYMEMFQNLFSGKAFGEFVIGATKFTSTWSILAFIMLVCGGLGYIFVIVTYVLGLVNSRLLNYNRLHAEEVPSEEAEAEKPAEDTNEAFAIADSAEEVKSEEVPATEEAVTGEEPAPAYEPMADFMVEPNEVAAQPEEIIVEELPVNKDSESKDSKLDANELASMIRDVVRDIVRDEMSRAKETKPEDEKPHRGEENRGAITGASFGGPLVVQYFNGGIQAGPAPAPVTTPAPVEAPVAPAPAPVAPAKEAPAPVAPAPVIVPSVKTEVKVEEKPAEPVEKKPIVRIPFHERLFAAEKEMQANYNELKNEFLSWGLKSRVSNSGDTFRLHRKTYAKLTIAGKSLKLYFALDPKAYDGTTIPVQDASGKGIYEEIPLVFKVKSPLSLRRCKQLIQDACEKDGLEQKEVETINWVKELKTEMKGK